MRRHYYNVIIIVVGDIGIEILIRCQTFVTSEILVNIGVFFVISLYAFVICAAFSVVLAGRSVPVMSFVGDPLFGVKDVLVTVVVGANVANDISVSINVSFNVLGSYGVAAGGLIPVIILVKVRSFAVGMIAELIVTDIANAVVVFGINVQSLIGFL